MSPHLTAWVILVFVLAIVAYDVIAYAMGGVQATISRVTLAAVSRWPILAVGVGVALGVLMGHLFWPQPTPGLCP